MNDYDDVYSWPEIMDVLMRNSKINIKPKPAAKPKPMKKKADNIHVY